MNRKVVWFIRISYLGLFWLIFVSPFIIELPVLKPHAYLSRVWLRDLFIATFPSFLQRQICFDANNEPFFFFEKMQILFLSFRPDFSIYVLTLVMTPFFLEKRRTYCLSYFLFFFSFGNTLKGTMVQAVFFSSCNQFKATFEGYPNLFFVRHLCLC